VTYDKGSVIQESFESFVHEVSDAQVHSVFNILASPLRRDLLLYLESQGKSIFTKIQQVLDVENAPNLSFHLRTLKNAGFIEENDEKRYFLSDMGKEVCDLLRRFEIAGVKKFESIIWTSTD
jgi:predicted transcriptional regulator